MFDAERPRCNAALDSGGLGVVVAGREGLTSLLLFFLGLPGLDRLEAVDFTVGLTGDDSRDALGEFVADVVCELYSFLLVGMDDVVVDVDGRLGVDDAAAGI